MQIPESIAKLTTEVSADILNQKPVEPELNVDEVILLLKRSLNLKQLESFEKGLTFYKTNVNSDKLIAQNIVSLFSESLLNALKNCDVVEEYKMPLSLNIKRTFVGLNEIIDSLYNNTAMLNKEKNLLDVREFTLIILGYAIGILKKIYNSRS